MKGVYAYDSREGGEWGLNTGIGRGPGDEKSGEASTPEGLL